MVHRFSFSLALTLCALFSTVSLRGQPVDPDSPRSPGAATTNRPAFVRGRNTNDLVTRIRDEGLNRSQVMETLSYLSDVIGPRLTGSPNLRRANEWTREKLSSWGLTNAHLEAWGPFGRGWSLKRFSAQVVEPQTFPLIGCPDAWSPGLEKPILADVVFFDAPTNGNFEKYKGKLKGAIVLATPTREVKARFEPFASRLADTNLLRLANAGPPRTFTGGGQSSAVSTNRGAAGAGRRRDASTSTNNVAASTNSAANRFSGSRSARILKFLADEGAALVVTASSQGDGGTFFVASASVPAPESQGTNAAPAAARIWATNAPATLPQVTLAVEDYNRMVRMIKQGEKLKMAVDLQVQFHTNDVMAYNTLAEIPGSDLKDELVMLGAHIDSWHSGTGATDNGAGVAVAMEAVRIIEALKLHPRRTIRIGLWSGEEEGLYGSRAYVAKHFGYYTNLTDSTAARSPRDGGERRSRSASTNSAGPRQLVKAAEYEKISSYFNLDNGTGKIRGVYMQGNEAVRPLFRKWLEPFYDLGAETLSLSNTGGTDHLSFDGIGIPGFQFIQDPMDYFTRTHHSNEDVFDRIQGEDLRQCATIMAAFVYQASVMDEKLPRKPLEP